MKRLLLLAMVPAIVAAQDAGVIPRRHYAHDGFYLSMSAGPAFGKIALAAHNTFFRDLSYSGAGGTVDF